MFQTNSLAAIGRLLLAILFIFSGFGKIIAPEAARVHRFGWPAAPAPFLLARGRR